MEDSKYENIISKYTYQQLVYERVIQLRQMKVHQKNLVILDEEFNRRLSNGNNISEK